MTLLQDNHGRIFLVVLVQDMSQVVLLHPLVVLLEHYQVVVDKVHGVTVQPQDLVVVLQVYT
tara:strand:+ start:96 stop:281 length:186 start_codon:yes stop_codon:yes gene_type:complete